MWDWLMRYPSVRIEQIGVRHEKGIQREDIPSYDYIVVGGGTAGCVLANRLSANPNVSVLLLERGAVRDSYFASSVLLSHPPFGLLPAKSIKLAPQKHLDRREMMSYESLTLGGRTRINAGLFLQGCPEEYNTWGEGWKWNDVAPFFARFERRLELESERTLPLEGGEWKTRIIKAEYESSRQFADALGRMGVPRLEAYTDPETPTCFGIYQRRCLDAAGRRCSTYHAFLPKPLVQQRKNLTICLGANVQRILFSNEADKLTATGLLVEGENSTNGIFVVQAKHEIILSSGAVVTPQLLLLSGVGPKEHLSEVQIPCIHDLPGVGSTLQDHLYVPITFFVPMRDSVHRALTNPLLALIGLIRFFLFGTGFFLSIISEYFCYVHTHALPPNHNRTSRALPDVELFWTAAYGAYTFPKFPSGKGAGSVMVQNCIPKSMGTVRLTREGAYNIKIDPIVDPGVLTAKEDWEVYRRGLLFALEVGKEMERGGYSLQEAQVPASSSREDLDAFIRKYSECSQHLLSSCRMKALHEGGVVDQELKVHGIEGLRIADGSVFPGMIASRPQATVVMIGERCAEFIRQGWRQQGLFSHASKA